MTDWDALLTAVDTTEVARRDTTPIEVPSALLDRMAELRKPGPSGGKLRASLPVSGEEEFLTVRKTLSAAARKLDPPASVTCKPVFAETDEIREETPDGVKFSIREGAVPVRISFSVGERRGRKTDSAEEAAEVAENGIEPANPAKPVVAAPKSRRGAKR